MFSPAIEKLVAQLTRLPGIGTRTAHRLAFHLLRTPKNEALELVAQFAYADREKRAVTVAVALHLVPGSNFSLHEERSLNPLSSRT